MVGVGRPTHAEFNPREELSGSSDLRNPPAPELRPHLRLERFGVPKVWFGPTRVFTFDLPYYYSVYSAFLP